MNDIYKESIFLSLIFVLTCASGVLSSLYAWNNQTDGVVIVDVFHSFLPDFSNFFSFPNVIFPLQYVLALISIKDERFQRVAQFVFLNCVVLTLRSVAITLTVLPNAVTKDFCSRRPDNVFEIIEYIFTHGTCGDFCFSGHTTTSILTYLTVIKYSKNTMQKAAQLFLLVVMVFVLLSMRWHYSIDCFVALLLSYFIFEKYYHEEDEKVYYFNSCSKKRRKRILSEDRGIYDGDL